MLLVLLVSRVLPLQQQRVALRHYGRPFRIRDAFGVKAHAGRRGGDVGIEGEAMEEEVDSEGAKDGERVIEPEAVCVVDILLSFAALLNPAERETEKTGKTEEREWHDLRDADGYAGMAGALLDFSGRASLRTAPLGPAGPDYKARSGGVRVSYMFRLLLLSRSFDSGPSHASRALAAIPSGNLSPGETTSTFFESMQCPYLAKSGIPKSLTPVQICDKDFSRL
ncbi:hypothetical protein K438DRAFT_1934774 [Mycena galopus ATCC 62051]|nr:hypothetical protein K438DRAFT_1934774 [Mycena galopus ATCC 62051]